MEHLLETLKRLEDQQRGILQAAMLRAAKSDLNGWELNQLGSGISDCLNDAFHDHTAPLLTELEDLDLQQADSEMHGDIVAFQGRLR